VIVIDMLLFCNLVLFAVCAIRSPRAKGTRIDDLVERATLSRVGPALVRAAAPAPAATDDKIVPFPSAAELARRHGRSLHPSTTLGRHPSRMG
jgi:hypothetical protein